MKPVLRLTVGVASFAMMTPVFAQLAPLAPAPTDNEVTAIFVDEAPRIDGHLDDDAWQGIEPITDFIQIWPDDGSPATQRSEVRIA